MRLPKACQIELAASGDVARNFCYPQLDVERKRIVATDGRILACVPVEVEDGDTSGRVSPEALKASRKASGPLGVPTLACGERLITSDGTLFKRPDNDSFPPVDQVIPEYRPGTAGTVSICLDPALLMALAKALGNGKNHGISLTINLPTGKERGASAGYSLEPVVVTTESCPGGIGVLMPCRP